MTTASLAQQYSQCFGPTLAIVETALREALPIDAQPQALWNAMRHGILQGGKRLRPVVLLETCLACGGHLESALPAAVALELVHGYSLIHDDLPCMDDDDFRRGQPTVHKAFGEAMAVLAGDALLTRAFELLLAPTPGLNAETQLAVARQLAQHAGMPGMVSGQVEDMQSQHLPPDALLLRRIHAGKTGALFAFAVWAGARLAGQPEPVCSAMRAIGAQLGLVFQMADDILDVSASSAALGKTAGKDVAQGKQTYPAVFGLAESRQMLTAEHRQLAAMIADLPGSVDTGALQLLADFAAGRTA